MFSHWYCAVKSKLKVTLVQALRLCTGRTAHRGSRGIVLPFHDHGTRRGEGSTARPDSTLPPGKTRYPLYRRLGGPQVRSGQVRKISLPTGIRSPDRPARSQSLYRLRYPAHSLRGVNVNSKLLSPCTEINFELPETTQTFPLNFQTTCMEQSRNMP